MFCCWQDQFKTMCAVWQYIYFDVILHLFCFASCQLKKISFNCKIIRSIYKTMWWMGPPGELKYYNGFKCSCKHMLMYVILLSHQSLLITWVKCCWLYARCLCLYFVTLHILHFMKIQHLRFHFFCLYICFYPTSFVQYLNLSGVLRWKIALWAASVVLVEVKRLNKIIKRCSYVICELFVVIVCHVKPHITTFAFSFQRQS